MNSWKKRKLPSGWRRIQEDDSTELTCPSSIWDLCLGWQPCLWAELKGSEQSERRREAQHKMNSQRWWMKPYRRNGSSHQVIQGGGGTQITGRVSLNLYWRIWCAMSSWMRLKQCIFRKFIISSAVSQSSQCLRSATDTIFLPESLDLKAMAFFMSLEFSIWFIGSSDQSTFIKLQLSPWDWAMCLCGR